MIEGMLDRLAELYVERDAATLKKEQDKKALIDSVLTPEIRAKVAEIEEEFSGPANSSEFLGMIQRLEDEIKSEVLKSGASVKGKVLQAVYSKGRITWDTSAMIGYAEAHPELNKFKKEGQPSISFRKVN